MSQPQATPSKSDMFYGPKTFGLPLTSPSIFKFIDGHVSVNGKGSTANANDDKFEVTFYVQIPNYSVTLIFRPNEFLTSQTAFVRFHEIRTKAVDGLNFDKQDTQDLLLPFMELLREERPRDDIKDSYYDLNLKDIEYKGCWELTCTYVDEKPTLQRIEHLPKADSFTIPSYFANGPVVRIFDHSEVFVAMNQAVSGRPFTSCAPPQKVRVRGRSYFYHPLGSSTSAMIAELMEHFDIIATGLSYQKTHILPLLGIVADEDQQCVGLLKEWRSTWDEDFLDRLMLESELDADRFREWAYELDNAIASIWGAGLDLMPTLWDVAVNKNGEVWIVFLRDGRVPVDGLNMHHALRLARG